MIQSRVLQENMRDVNRVLMRVSGVGITLLYGLSFILFTLGYVTISLQHLLIAAISSYAFYFLTLLLYRIKRLRPSFHFIFPLNLYVTVAIGVYYFAPPLSAYAIWLIPLIYAGMYAHRGSMLLITLLVLVTAPLEAYWLGGGKELTALISEIAIGSVVLLILSLRMISLVGRSRSIIHKTEQEMEKNLQLQKKNELLMAEVAATADEIGRVVRQLTQMTRDTRDALTQISRGGDEIIASSHDSRQVLLQNQASVEAQVAKTDQIRGMTEQAVLHAQLVQEQAEEGEQAVETLAQVIQTMDRKSRDTIAKVERLAERTQEITAISQSISGIAKNVTIVAINASIEAARAGAAGRTFQVVAEQVQDLALQSSRAAEAIGELADRVQADLQRVSQIIDENSGVVQEGVAISAEARTKLQAISNAVDEIHQLLQSVAAETEWQQRSAQEIAAGIATLREKTEQNVHSIETSAASTEETAAIMEEYVSIVGRLHERAQTLQGMMAKFGIQQNADRE